MSNSRFNPSLDRLSVLSATILLAYTLTGIIRIPVREIATQLPGFYLEIQINFQTIVSFLVAGLAVSGTDWLLREHPSKKNQRLIQHWFLPALTAWVIGVPLYQQALGLYWWAGILLGGGVLILVLVAEFIVVDPEDPRYSLATIGLTAVAHALFFLLAVTLRAAQIRLFLLIPALTIAVALVSFRTLRLQTQDQTSFLAAGISALILAEITAAAHYLPLSPIAFGLFLLGPTYGLTNLLVNLDKGKELRNFIIEPLVVLIIFWGMAFWFQ